MILRALADEVPAHLSTFPRFRGSMKSGRRKVFTQVKRGLGPPVTRAGAAGAVAKSARCLKES